MYGTSYHSILRRPLPCKHSNPGWCSIRYNYTLCTYFLKLPRHNHVQFTLYDDVPVLALCHIGRKRRTLRSVDVTFLIHINITVDVTILIHIHLKSHVTFLIHINYTIKDTFLIHINLTTDVTFLIHINLMTDVTILIHNNLTTDVTFIIHINRIIYRVHLIER